LQLIKQDPEFYNKLHKTTETLDFEIGKILNEKGIRHKINRKGSMMSIFFNVTSVSNFNEVNNSDIGIFNNLFHQVLEQGIYLPPSGYETWFISSAIGDTEIDKTLEAFRNFQY
jgi:glutamate-1-semialdehyde 2,1-aminomutase